jgi:hypothetical protein
MMRNPPLLMAAIVLFFLEIQTVYAETPLPSPHGRLAFFALGTMPTNHDLSMPGDTIPQTTIHGGQGAGLKAAYTLRLPSAMWELS